MRRVKVAFQDILLLPNSNKTFFFDGKQWEKCTETGAAVVIGHFKPDDIVEIETPLTFCDIKECKQKFRIPGSSNVYVRLAQEMTASLSNWKANAFCIEGQTGAKYNHAFFAKNEIVELVD